MLFCMETMPEPRRRTIFTTNSSRTASNMHLRINRGEENVNEENDESDDYIMQGNVDGDHDEYEHYQPNLNDILPNDADAGNDTNLFLHAVHFILIAIVIGVWMVQLIPKLADLNNSRPNAYGPKPDEATFFNENLRHKQSEEIINLSKKLESLREEFAALSKQMDETLQLKTALQSNLNIAIDENLQKHIKNKIQEALKLYDADKVGTIDYALESAGGSIFSIPETKAYPSRVSLYLGLINMQFKSNPRIMITPGTLPGQCFAFYGSVGHIRIALTHTIFIHSVTIEHAYTTLLEDQRSAPKSFAIYGLNDPAAHIRGDELGKFVYQLSGNPLQTFIVDKRMNWKPYAYVELHILSNYGHPEYTCVYRFRVHGTGS